MVSWRIWGCRAANRLIYTGYLSFCRCSSFIHLVLSPVPAELYECTRKELVKRLYKVTAMAAEGRVQFLFHQEARDQKTLTSLYGAGTSQFCQSNPSPKLRLSVSNFNMLVEGYDFELTVTGEIKFKDDRPC